METIPMPRLDGILEAALYVDHLERSVWFFQALFGFDVIASSERLWAMVGNGRGGQAGSATLQKRGLGQSGTWGPRRTGSVALGVCCACFRIGGLGIPVADAWCADRGTAKLGIGGKKCVLSRPRSALDRISHAGNLECLLILRADSCLRFPVKGDGAQSCKSSRLRIPILPSRGCDTGLRFFKIWNLPFALRHRTKNRG
jgi:catechol 2,3-dioxygenase-like lactoylglutathione lyase family enzyme